MNDTLSSSRDAASKSINDECLKICHEIVPKSTALPLEVVSNLFLINTFMAAQRIKFLMYIDCVYVRASCDGDRVKPINHVVAAPHIPEPPSLAVITSN